jgi:hypothetical protein
MKGALQKLAAQNGRTRRYARAYAVKGCTKIKDSITLYPRINIYGKALNDIQYCSGFSPGLVLSNHT